MTDWLMQAVADAMAEVTLHRAMWLVTAASIVGVVANIHKRRWAFGVWICTNCMWAAYDAAIGAYAQSVLQCVYAVLSVWGLIAWGRKQTLRCECGAAYTGDGFVCDICAQPVCRECQKFTGCYAGICIECEAARNLEQQRSDDEEEADH